MRTVNMAIRGVVERLLNLSMRALNGFHGMHLDFLRARGAVLKHELAAAVAHSDQVLLQAGGGEQKRAKRKRGKQRSVQPFHTCIPWLCGAAEMSKRCPLVKTPKLQNRPHTMKRARGDEEDVEMRSGTYVEGELAVRRSLKESFLTFLSPSSRRAGCSAACAREGRAGRAFDAG